MSRANASARLVAASVALAWGGLACARPEVPPGGPEDRFPPYVVATVPDTFAVVEEGLRDFEFKFSERISERVANGSLQDAVVVSPSAGAVRVRHSRDAISVETQQGLLPNRVYRITMLPVVNDMFGNSLRDPFDLVVSTGADFVPNVLAGVVENRVDGTAAQGARVEAVFAQEDDTTAHWTYADAEGFYTLRFVSGGAFELRAWQDRNRDGEAGAGEPVTSQLGGLARDAPDTAYGVLSLIEPDTTAAQIVSATVSDSVTIRFDFDDYLDPRAPSEMIEGVLFPGGDEPLIVFRLRHDHELDAWRAEQADSAAGDAAGGDVAEPATGLAGLVLPAQSLTGTLDEPLEPNRAYEAVLSGVANLAGLEARGAKIVVAWEVVPPDSAEAGEAVPDTTQAPPDTVQTPPDSAQAPPDTVQTPPDTVQAPPDTTQAPPDTTQAPPDMLRPSVRAAGSGR